MSMRSVLIAEAGPGLGAALADTFAAAARARFTGGWTRTGLMA
jgi:hypothetical protein